MMNPASARDSRARRAGLPQGPGRRRRPRILQWVAAAIRDFAAARTGGAMLVSGAVALLVMGTVGSLMTNYAWRDAQWAEIRAATRAAIAAAGPLFSDVDAHREAIQERIAAFASAAKPGLEVDPEGVGLEYDPETRATTIVVRGRYAFDELWGRDGEREDVADVVRVALGIGKYEVAVAVDMSGSMNQEFGVDQVSKMDGVKEALGTVADLVAPAGRTNPGGILVSLVPFSNAVAAADTCNRDPVGGECRPDRSPGKERYLRMLAGAEGTIDEALARAKLAKQDGVGGHWVDAYLSYGMGRNMGPLRRRFLPDGLLDDVDWNLRREDVEIDVSEQIPLMGVWKTRDADFWNGCLMARWGAYWDPAARPIGWEPDDMSVRPPRMPVPAWSAGATALNNAQLHLSDAPPMAAHPNTLFTAYSYPDADISGYADWRIEATMVRMLDGGLAANPARADNSWSRPGQRGELGCKRTPVLPLTGDIDVFRRAVNELDPDAFFAPEENTDYWPGGSLPHLGVVWALRTLSPLWQPVWDVKDSRDMARPAVPCTDATDEDCLPNLGKTIILVTDGQGFIGRIMAGRVYPDEDDEVNPAWKEYPRVCAFTWNPVSRTWSAAFPNYRTAISERAAGRLRAAIEEFYPPKIREYMVHEDGTFTDEGVEHIVRSLLYYERELEDPDACDVQSYQPKLSNPDEEWDMPVPVCDRPQRQAAMIRALRTFFDDNDFTVWDFYIDLDPDLVDLLMARSPNNDPGEPENPFGFDTRPVQFGHMCHASSPFTPYGRINDQVYVGEDQTHPFPVQQDVWGTDHAPSIASAAAPLSLAKLSPASVPWGNVDGSLQDNKKYVSDKMANRLDGWLSTACVIAGKRGVRIEAIFVGNDQNTDGLEPLEACVDRNRKELGEPPENYAERDVLVTPTKAELVAALQASFAPGRGLRFLN